MLSRFGHSHAEEGWAAASPAVADCGGFAYRVEVGEKYKEVGEKYKEVGEKYKEKRIKCIKLSGIRDSERSEAQLMSASERPKRDRNSGAIQKL